MTQIENPLAQIMAQAETLAYIDLFDPSGNVKKGEGFCIREYSGRTHLYVLGGFGSTLRWREATEISEQGRQQLVRFFIPSRWITPGTHLSICVDPNNEQAVTRFMVSELSWVGPVILKTPKEGERNGR